MTQSIINRDEQHGGMEAVGGMSQSLKIAIHAGKNWFLLTPGEQEALDIIAHKTARVLSGGDPHDPEHWTDIAGYAQAAMRDWPAELETLPAQPAKRPAGELVGGVANLLRDYERGDADARDVIREVAAWLDQVENSFSAERLRREAGR